MLFHPKSIIIFTQHMITMMMCFKKDQKTFIDNYKAVLDNMSNNQLDNLLRSTSGANAEGINLKKSLYVVT